MLIFELIWVICYKMEYDFASFLLTCSCENDILKMQKNYNFDKRGERYMKDKNIKLMRNVLLFFIIIIIGLGVIDKVQAAKSYYQYVKTGIDQFPGSYKERLQQLANQYPNWKFQAYYTGIQWDELIENERDESVHRNRVTNNAPVSWKHCDFVDDGWACASDAAVKYYLDPRNFLNETQIFQFVETSYNEKVQTLSAIQNSVKGTFLDQVITCKDLNNNTVTMSYSEIIIEAAKKTNISAFAIKSKIIQEVGSSGSGSVSGTYPGYEGYYNFFNYGAYDDGDDIANGLEYAKSKGWDSQYKAIVGGAELIGKYYIEQGQNTAYFTKWDVVGTKILNDGESQFVSSSDMFWHQYMTNIQDPTSQSYSTKKLYENSLQSEITFIIPVYENMPESNPMPQDVSVESITLNKEKFVINIDEKDTVKATINPSNATNKNVIWEVSDSEIIRLWNGDFRGLKEGTVTITAKTQDGGKIATCQVIVRDPNKNYVQEIKMEQSEYIINIDEATDIKYSYLPTDSVNTEFNWTTDNSDVIRVWGNKVRALKEGVAQVIATNDEGTVEAKCKVIVRDPNKVYVNNINVSKDKYFIEVDEAVDIEYSYLPTNASNANFEWTTDNSDVIRVWGNRVRGLKEGTAKVMVKTEDETVESSFYVIVRNPNLTYVEDINFDKEEYVVDLDEAIDIEYSYSPSNASNAEFEWNSTDPEVIRVFGNRFRGLKEGTAYILVKTKDESIEKKIKVTVKDYSKINVEEITTEKDEYTIAIDEAVDVNYTYFPIEAGNAQFDWISSNPEVLRVFGNRFRGLKEGTAEVIVRTTDGTIEKRIKVTVKGTNNKYVSSINLEKTEYTANVDEAIDIPFTYTPEDAINAEFEWTTDSPDIIRVWGNRFRALKEGTAQVIVRTTDGTIEKRIKVTIKGTNNKYVSSINLEKTEYTANVDEAIDIPFTYTPEDAINAEFEWTTDNPDVIRVWGNRFRALKEGTAQIIVRTTDGTIERKIQVIVK